MAYITYNPNPDGHDTGDCVIRGLCLLLDSEWEKIYMDLTLKGLQMSMWGDTNAVWESYLREKGYKREAIPNTCPDCYTIAAFAADHPEGKYLVATGTHVVAVCDGNYYDSWDSGHLIPSYYYFKEEDAA